MHFATSITASITTTFATVLASAITTSIATAPTATISAAVASFVLTAIIATILVSISLARRKTPAALPRQPAPQRVGVAADGCLFKLHEKRKLGER